MENASIICWGSHLSTEEVKAIIKELKERGLIDRDETREYDPYYGSPVWYIP